MIIEFSAGISGKNNKVLMQAIYQHLFKDRLPDTILVDDVPAPFSGPDFFTEWPAYKNDIFIEWEKFGYLSIKYNDIVWFGLSSFDLQVPEVLSWLEKLPFEIASFGTAYPEWLYPVISYEAPSFSQFHLPHGWACAFKGLGLERLVSSRWLDFGPWKQHKGKNDTLLIQFHQLDINAEEALSQAKPGHILVGITDEGGFLQQPYVYQFDNEGLYDPIEKKLKVVVHGREISNRQLLDASATKRYQALGKDKPLSNIAYVFMEEALATKHLHQIWLRSLECRTIKGGQEVRLDNSYHPSAVKPQWVINTR